ncbi:hypothetical protein ACP4OV_029808 [Aristida adscensionis]
MAMRGHCNGNGNGHGYGYGHGHGYGYGHGHGHQPQPAAHCNSSGKVVAKPGCHGGAVNQHYVHTESSKVVDGSCNTQKPAANHCAGGVGGSYGYGGYGYGGAQQRYEESREEYEETSYEAHGGATYGGGVYEETSFEAEEEVTVSHGGCAQLRRPCPVPY